MSGDSPYFPTKRRSVATLARLKVSALRARHRARSLVDVTRQLSMLLRSGESLDQALSTLIAITDAESMRPLWIDIQRQLREGQSLAQAMSNFDDTFSELYINAVEIGEANGDLPAAFERLADHLERQSALSESIKSALIYPTILIVITGLSMVVLFAFVLPTFRLMFDSVGVTLPLLTETLLRAGDLTRRYGLILLVIAVAGLWLFKRQLQDAHSRYRWHHLLIRMPLVGELIRRLDIARFCHGLSTLLRGGTPLVPALRLSQATVSNMFLRQSLDQVIQQVKEGRPLGQAVTISELFPSLAAHMVHVGEQSGELDRSLTYVAAEYDKQFEAAMRRLVAILEPTLIIGIGALIAVIIFAILSAIQRLNALPF